MKKIKKITAILFLVSFPLWLIAQPPHPNDGNLPGPGNTTVGGQGCCTCPVDGGISILLGLGLAFGAGFALASYLSQKKTVSP
jgi:hypothetical protein